MLLRILSVSYCDDLQRIWFFKNILYLVVRFFCEKGYQITSSMCILNLCWYSAFHEKISCFYHLIQI